MPYAVCKKCGVTYSYPITEPKAEHHCKKGHKATPITTKNADIKEKYFKSPDTIEVKKSVVYEYKEDDKEKGEDETDE